MRKLLLFLITTVLATSASFGQNHGFMGKHLTLEYDLQIMPRTFLVRDLRDLDQIPYVSFAHQVEASAIISRHTMMHTFYQYGNFTALKYSKEGLTEHAPISCTTNSIGGGFSFYLKNGSSPLAPVGSYIKAALMYTTYTLRDEEGLFDYDDFSSPVPQKAEEFNGHSVQLVLGKGRTRIIKERIILDYGASFILGLEKTMEHTSGDENYNFSRYERAVAVGLQANMFTVHLGVGGLLF